MDSTVDKAPSVVAVVLTRGGSEAGETTDSLDAQDYPSLQVGTVDVDRGWSAIDDLDDAAAEGGYLLFLHDDVVLEPDAVRAMVTTAQVTGAGVVGPKLVRWDDPRRLLEYGCSIDKTGKILPLVERGDLDQGQYDELGEVFAVPGACMLVRADVFRSVGGFDPVLGPFGDDVGLCWRARLAGARVVVAPGARARHKEAPRSTRARRRLLARQRVRTVLTCYGRLHAARVLPQVVATEMAETVGALATARPTDAAAMVTAWGWNLRRCRSLWGTRRQVRGFRQVPDAEVRRYQASGVVRPRLAARRLARPDPDPTPAAVTGAPPSEWTSGDTAIGLLLVGVFLLGSRHLLTRGVPVVGELLPFGVPGVRTLATVGLIPVGIVGALVAGGPARSPRAAVATAVAYAAVPIPYVALESGHWAPLALYATAPWWVHWLGDWRRVLLLGMSTALVAAVVPSAPVLLVGTAVALAVGGLAAFRPRGGFGLVATALVGATIALVLQLPWALDPRISLTRASGARLDPVDVLEFGGDAQPWLWALPLLALIPLLRGRGERLTGAIRAWTLAVSAWVAAFAADRVGIDVPVLVLAAAGIAVAVGLAVATVEQDIAPPATRRIRRRDKRRWRAPTHARRLGARSLTGALVATGLACATIPLLVGSLAGDWGMPGGELSRVLSFVDADVTADDAAVLWIADPDIAPLRQARARVAGTQAALGLTKGLPKMGDRWRPVARERLGGAVAVGDDSTRLGRRLAPLGVAYVVVPKGLALTTSDAAVDPSTTSRSLETTFDGQLDLERIDLDPAVAVYRNLAFRPDLVEQAPPDAWERSWPWRLRAGLVAWTVAVGLLVVLARRKAAT